MVYLERSANKWPLMPEYFSFFLIDADGKPEFFRLRRDFIDLGGDYTLLDQQNKVSDISTAACSRSAGNWKGRVKAGHKSAKKLLAVMKLFCGVIIFNGQNRRHVKNLRRDVRAGRLDPKLERQEVRSLSQSAAGAVSSPSPDNSLSTN